jgi:hypothetical protein
MRYTLCDNNLNICPNFIANDPILEDVLFWIGYFNSMINPFLYNFTNPDFQKAFRKLLHIKRDNEYYKNNSIAVPSNRRRSTRTQEKLDT